MKSEAMSRILYKLLEIRIRKDPDFDYICTCDSTKLCRLDLAPWFRWMLCEDGIWVRGKLIEDLGA